MIPFGKVSEIFIFIFLDFSSVQSLSHVRLFATPWTAACQASLSITNSRSLSKCMSTESVMPSNHLIFCYPLLSCPQSFPESGSFPVSQLFTSGVQRIGISASISVLPMNYIEMKNVNHGYFILAFLKDEINKMYKVPNKSYLINVYYPLAPCYTDIVENT